jgi:uncharacterized UPF0146 family protein
LSADLVTVITSVTDPEGNQVNDLTAKDFEIYEDDVLQPLAGMYREAQLPLRLVFFSIRPCQFATASILSRGRRHSFFVN